MPLKNYKEPENLKQLETFLGMATSYSKFVYGFGEKINILQIIKNSKTFVWSAQAKQCFDSIKIEISKSFLAVPAFNRPMILETDTSGSAIAGVLIQDGRPIAVASRRVSETEKSWATVELEVLAIVYCVEKFRYFLLGKRFNLYTDQQALAYIFKGTAKSACKNNKLIRWRNELSEYDYSLSYKPGKDNVAADAFSQALAVASLKPTFSVTSFKNAQSKDPEISTLMDSLETDVRPSQVSLSLWSNRKRMKIINGILCLVEAGNGPRIVCPESFKTAVIDRAHNKFGHLGINATVSLIREGFFWINFRSEIVEYVRNCQIGCETRPRFQKPEDGTLISSSKPMERLSHDLIGPKTPPSGKKK